MKKKTAWLLISIICIALINPTAHCEEPYDRVYAYQGEVAIVKRDGLAGLIDKSDELVLPVEYEWIGIFQYGLAYVEDADGRMGVVNNMGELIVSAEYYSFEFQPTSSESKEGIIMYTEISGVRESEEYERGRWSIYMPGRIGMMDKAGNKLTEAMYDSYVLCPQTPYTNVERDGKWNTLNSKGELLYSIWFDTMETYEKTDYIYGYVICTIGDTKYEYTYVDRKITSEQKEISKWEWEQQAIYDERGNRVALDSGYKSYEIHPETGLVAYEKKDSAGIRDQYGNELIPTNYGSAYIEYADGNFFIIAIMDDAERHWAIYDIDGNELIPPVYDLGGSMDEKHIYAWDDNGKMGLITIYGDMLIEPKWGMIDRWRDEAIPGCEYLAHEEHEGGTKKNYALDGNGIILQELPCSYDWAAFSHGSEYALYYAYTTNQDGSSYAKEWVMKNRNGDTLYRLSDDILCASLLEREIRYGEVTDNGTWVFHNDENERVAGIVTGSGEIITKENWMHLQEFRFGKAFVRLKDHSYVVIDESGNTLFVPQFFTPVGENFYPISVLEYELYGDAVVAVYHGDYINEEGLCIWTTPWADQQASKE